jgi:formylglycine-generating enzyme required for sulfatase activity
MKKKDLAPTIFLIAALAVTTLSCKKDDNIDQDDDDQNPPPTFTMKTVPAAVMCGDFTMGCTNGDPECAMWEFPIHSVTLPAYMIGETEVTQAQWEHVMDSVGIQNPSNFGDCPTCPVENVSWFDAIVFCNRFSELSGLKPCYYGDTSLTNIYGKDGSTWSLPNSGSIYWDSTANGYRLPTEAEWERAARGGSATQIYAGSDYLYEVGWYSENNDDKTHPVKGKLPNAYGLYDMSGNVWELTYDWFSLAYTDSLCVHNPTGGPPLINFISRRTLRGGSWRVDSEYCRVSQRSSGPMNLRKYQIGFRLSKSF